MNKIAILATLTKDVEIKYTSSGTAIGAFSLAYNEKRKTQDGSYQDVPMFFECTAFGKTAENIENFFSRGSRILIDGSLDFQQWEKDGQKRSKVGIKVNGFDFIDKKSQGNNNGYQVQVEDKQGNVQKTMPQPNIPEIDVNEDEIPF